MIRRILLPLLLVMAWVPFISLAEANDVYRTLDVTLTDGTHSLIALQPSMSIDCNEDGLTVRMGKYHFSFDRSAVSHFSFNKEPGSISDPDNPADNLTEYCTLNVILTDGTHSLIALQPSMSVDCNENELTVRMGKYHFSFDRAAVSHFSFNNEPGNISDPDNPADNITEYRSLDVISPDDMHTYIALQKDMRIYFDSKQSLTIDAGGGIFTFEPAALKYFEFSNEEGETRIPESVKGIEAINESAAEHFLFDGRKITVFSEGNTSINARLIDMKGIILGTFEDNPVEISVVTLSPGTYIVSTSHNSFKIIVK